MGARSRLVLEKLGFDLREHYEEVLSAPAPDHLRALIERLAAEMVRLPRIEDGPRV
jgi:CO dehydrogenase/acetyl-CoA synthase delta subunit